MFKGEFYHTLDAKNRLVAPSKLREKLGEQFVITKGFDKCLYIFPNGPWEEFVAKIDGLKLSREKARKVQRRFVGSAADCEPDKQGRFLIPANLREYAEITKDVVLIGLSNKIEVWSQEVWDAYNSEDDDTIDDVEGELDF